MIVGSVNMDLVARMKRLPRPGETVSGDSFQTIPGGKGANQAVAAARLGGQVAMIARVGQDAFGSVLRENLTAEGIDCKSVLVTEGCSSGVALIGVDTSGANCITVVPAANGRLTPADVMSSCRSIETAQALIVQLETPIETIEVAIEIAQRNRVLTILDPAPAPSGRLPARLLSVDVISPNQTEAEALTGIAVHDWESGIAAAHELRRQGAKQVVLKMGEMGALVLSDDGNVSRIKAFPADIVDTTAAGDAFTAALTIALCEGRCLADATQWAVLAGTLACTRVGAQPAMPTRSELLAFGSANGCVLIE